jgi:uncharacterized repeat protein (TIGR03803 family)
MLRQGPVLGSRDAAGVSPPILPLNKVFSEIGEYCSTSGVLHTGTKSPQTNNNENGMKFLNFVLKKHRRLTSALRGTVAALAVTLILMPNSWAASRERVLHTFNIATAGFPVSGLAMDANENLYGTTRLGGVGGCSEGCGVVFKLTRNNKGGATYSVLHTFAGAFSDGGNPFGAPIVDSAGNVYGTTTNGGKGDCGVVYRLSPTAGGEYKETILHSFNRFTKRNDDGCGPESSLVSDAAGNLYGTTNKGGGGGVNGTFCDNGCGSVFKLAPNGDGTYIESVIHSFPGTKGNRDGQNPVGGVILDSAGNLWGSTPAGGNGNGTVFELTPNSDGTYTESTLFMFTGASTGFDPNTDLVIDQAGNIYGTAVNGGLGKGVVFKVTPQAGGGVKESVIHAFALCNATICPDGLFPSNGLTIDANGTLYGPLDPAGGASNHCSTRTPALGCGIVYKLTPNAKGKFAETILYRFRGFADGATPEDGRLVIDASGNIFGTTAEGGNSTACPSGPFGTPGGCGVVFEVTP